MPRSSRRDRSSVFHSRTRARAHRSPCCRGRCRRPRHLPVRAGGITVMLAMPPMLSATRVRLRMAEQQVIDERHQRRALAAGGDVARAEVRDHRDAGAFGDHGRFADLQGVGAALVIDGLAVAADQFAPGRSARRRRAPRARRVRQVGNSGARSPPCGGRVGDAENGGAHRGGVRRRREADGFHLPSADFDDGDVDAVERSTAHHSGDSHDRFNSFCNSLSNCSASMGRSSSRLRPRMRSAMP